jgi:hypothetical protein
MSNYHFKDQRLSLKAKGLISEMLSLPDEWDYSIAGLVSLNQENESAIKSALKELKNAGYLEIKKILPNKENNGRIEYEYILHEMPIQQGKIQAVENQPAEILSVEIQAVENQGQLNTNILNTKEQNTKDILEKEIVKKDSRFIPPSLDEVRAYCKERNNNVNPERFFSYYEAGNWKDGKGNPVKNWKQKIITWERNSLDQKPMPKPQAKNVNPFDELWKEYGYDAEGVDTALENIIGKLPECHQ